jgi:hypothetical protein
MKKLFFFRILMKLEFYEKIIIFFRILMKLEFYKKNIFSQNCNETLILGKNYFFPEF